MKNFLFVILVLLVTSCGVITTNPWDTFVLDEEYQLSNTTDELFRAMLKKRLFYIRDNFDEWYSPLQFISQSGGDCEDIAVYTLQLFYSRWGKKGNLIRVVENNLSLSSHIVPVIDGRVYEVSSNNNFKLCNVTVYDSVEQYLKLTQYKTQTATIEFNTAMIMAWY